MSATSAAPAAARQASTGLVGVLRHGHIERIRSVYYLDELGKKQAAEAAARIAQRLDGRPAVVLAAEVCRCTETAKIIAARLGARMETADYLGASHPCQETKAGLERDIWRYARSGRAVIVVADRFQVNCLMGVEAAAHCQVFFSDRPI